MKFDSIWAAAGTPNAVFNLQSKNLVEMTEGKIISISPVL
jgi:prolyl-tRNA editing enzyme YbaK/EbsC (Cys-tRNA(Pro) deacylase)